MPKILSVASRMNEKTRKDSLFEQVWDWFSSLDRFWRFTILTMILLLIAVPVIVGSKEIFTSHASTTLPPDGFGLYEACSPLYDEPSYNDGTPCLNNLQNMAQGGFSLVLNYGQLQASAADELQYLQTARTLGIKIIFALNDPRLWDGSTNALRYYSALAKTCSTPSGTQCVTNADFVTYIVNLVKNNPAIWGYYVGDEINSASISAWLTHSNLIHQADPTHPRLLVLGTQSTSSSPVANPLFSQVAAGAEVIGQDWYPLGDSAIGTMSQAGQLASSMQSVADSLGKQSAFVLQQMSWQEYYPPARCAPWPTCAPFPNFSQLQQMLTDTLHNSSPRLVLYYSNFDMWNSAYYQKVTGDFETQQAHWDDLVLLTKSLLPSPTPLPTSIPTPTPTESPFITIPPTQEPTQSPDSSRFHPRATWAPSQTGNHGNPHEYDRPPDSQEISIPPLEVEQTQVQSNRSLFGQLVSVILSVNNTISGSLKGIVYSLIHLGIKH